MPMSHQPSDNLTYPYEGDTTADFANRPFAPLDNYRSDIMSVQCPCCNSGTLQSNKIDNLPFDTTARGVLDAVKAGKQAHALMAGAVWAGIALLNNMRADWKCETCGAVF